MQRWQRGPMRRIANPENRGFKSLPLLHTARYVSLRPGDGNKGKPKSEEHKRKIALNRKGGRPKKIIGDVT